MQHFLNSGWNIEYNNMLKKGFATAIKANAGKAVGLMSEKIFATAKELKDGKYVLVDDIPCRVVQVETSKSGKHGGAKMRIVAIGIFDGQKKTLLTPGDQDVEVPIIERRNVLIMSVNGKTAQVMDKDTSEMYEIELSDELLATAESGKEAEVLQAMGRRKVERIKQ
jgi:translation initiation factor 5A